MNLFGVLEVSGSALKAERIRAEVVAANMANAETTRTADGTPYRRQHVVFQAEAAAQPGFASHMLGPVGSLSPELMGPGSANVADGGAVGGVEVSAVVADQGPPLRRYDPQHPDADKNGYVNYPDINPLTEMVDLMGATRAYGLNSSAIQATKSMITSSLDILK
ncbi:flagellar basal body rod protein FlgC [Acidipila rosea]|uniref:Flagellar basal-body rod protein FlgC n=1 Tax=Acidipila rosea TaxID=768535 RepID=A0A4R1L9W9_9BACT|nr:flagellar basal body rod protein FlgC [Acidipila rosea]TCK75072.1 flagellar basal-body rod protein FlgC [Acidipila rosea]